METPNIIRMVASFISDHFDQIIYFRTLTLQPLTRTSNANNHIQRWLKQTTVHAVASTPTTTETHNMPSPIYGAFIPELCATVALLIKSPLNRSRDPNGQVYWTGYIFWCTFEENENGDLQKQWTTSLVDCSLSNNELAGGFEHVCVVDGQVMFYDFIPDDTNKATGYPFWHYPQQKNNAS